MYWLTGKIRIEPPTNRVLLSLITPQNKEHNHNHYAKSTQNRSNSTLATATQKSYFPHYEVRHHGSKYRTPAILQFPASVQSRYALKQGPGSHPRLTKDQIPRTLTTAPGHRNPPRFPRLLDPKISPFAHKKHRIADRNMGDQQQQESKRPCSRVRDVPLASSMAGA